MFFIEMRRKKKGRFWPLCIPFIERTNDNVENSIHWFLYRRL